MRILITPCSIACRKRRPSPGRRNWPGNPSENSIPVSATPRLGDAFGGHGPRVYYDILVTI